jgi:hypothetical protein
MRVLVAAFVIGSIPAVALAGFLSVEEGARATGMGGAFVAVADDATAVMWNPAGSAFTEGFELTGMRTRLFSVEDLTEDCVALNYGGWEKTGVGFGWTRTGLNDVYSENTFILGAGRRFLRDGLAVGAALRIYRVAAPGYEYYNDPNFEDGATGYAGDIGLMYRTRRWSLACVWRNIGDPELKLIDTTEEPDPIYSELRIGGTYTFREVMLVSGELRRPRGAPGYYDGKISYYLGTEIWFFDVFALRTGLLRNHATAGLGLRIDWLTVDAALVSSGRVGNKYRLALSLDF